MSREKGEIREIFLVVLGVGKVGSTLIEQILETRPLHAARFGLRLRLSILCDSAGWVFVPDDDSSVSRLLGWKAEGRAFSDHPEGRRQGDWIERIPRRVDSPTIVVDCSADEETGPVLTAALDAGCGVVSANKLPFAGPQNLYDRLTGGDGGRRRNCRWEATVASGVPVIAAMARMAAAGDAIRAIRGAVSGTLGKLMTGLEEGHDFSALVFDAMRKGATEPDVRQDLSGADAARKALILSRGAGFPRELSAVAREPLYPAEWDTLELDAFLQRLPELDAPFRKAAERARESDKVMRYALEVTAHDCRVGPLSVSRQDPLASLRGSDNLVAFQSRWYPDEPLVLRGRGAGVQATASGVLADIVEIADALALS